MIGRIPHTYIILYRAIYLIPVYICITGATYIHTKTRLVTTDGNTTDQGKQVSLTFMATAPTLGVVSPALQPRHQHPRSAVLACGGGAGGGRDACLNYWGKGGQWWQEKQASLQPGCPSSYHHTLSILAWGEVRGALYAPSHPRPQPWSLVPSGGAPLLCQWCGAFWNV